MALLAALLAVVLAADAEPRAGPQCQLDPGVSYDGHDIDKGEASSPSECCGLCSARQGCSGWTLYEQVCYLKGNGTAGRKPCAECSSGTPPACAGLGRSGCAASGPRCEWGGGSGCEPAPAPPPWTPPPQLPPKWNMSGMTFTGGRYCPNVTMGGTASQQSLAHLASTGANCALPWLPWLPPPGRLVPRFCVLRALLRQGWRSW